MTPEQAHVLLAKILSDRLMERPQSDREILQPTYIMIVETLRPKPPMEAVSMNKASGVVNEVTLAGK
jgi:hypothetical protein